MAWDSISKFTIINYKIVTAGEHFNKSTTYVRSSLYRLIIQWFAFLSLLSYSILMLRPYSIAWAGTTVLVSYYFTYVPLEVPLNFLLCCRLMNCLYCHPILSHCLPKSLPKSVNFCPFPSWLPAQYALPCLSINVLAGKWRYSSLARGYRYAVLGNAFCMEMLINWGRQTK